DGIVDSADYAFWRNNLIPPPVPSPLLAASAQASAPEPSALYAFATAACIAASRYRCKRRPLA
ncbi:MAG: PEP-CTERM sorting domain-containing protein, partial [Planctomycetota bacterium]